MYKRQQAGSVIDVSSGAALRAKGKVTGGKGGNVTVEAVAAGTAAGGRLVLDAELRGYGVEGGGTLAVTAGKVVLGAKPSDAGDDVLALAAPLFQQGFSRYEITGSRGASVAEDMRIDVSMPVYRPVTGAIGLATGAPARAALETCLLYTSDAADE